MTGSNYVELITDPNSNSYKLKIYTEDITLAGDKTSTINVAYADDPNHIQEDFVLDVTILPCQTEISL